MLHANTKQVMAFFHDVIANDVPGLKFRIWMFGSPYWENYEPDDEFDLALEVLSPVEDADVLTYWAKFHGGWERFLVRQLGIPARIALYRGPELTPAIHAALNDSSQIIYRSHPDPIEGL